MLRRLLASCKPSWCWLIDITVVLSSSSTTRCVWCLCSLRNQNFEGLFDPTKPDLFFCCGCSRRILPIPCSTLGCFNFSKVEKQHEGLCKKLLSKLSQPILHRETTHIETPSILVIIFGIHMEPVLDWSLLSSKCSPDTYSNKGPKVVCFHHVNEGL